MEFLTERNFPKVSIIIPHYKGRRLIRECLSSLKQLNYPKEQLEIKVVDNCSPDGSLRGVRKEFPRVSVLKNKENNYCKANNIGFEYSQGQYVGFLNNDTVVEKNWLMNLVKVMEKDKNIGCAGGKILLPDGRIQSAGHVEFPGHYWGDRGFHEPDLGQYNMPEELESLSGSALLFRRDCLKEVGEFDEDFVMYLDDIDIFFRCRKQGWKICYVPESIVYHKFHGTADEKQARFYIERNRLLLIAKHFPDELGRSLEGGRHLLSQDELFKVLPDMFLKLFKHHGNKINDAQISTFFVGLQHLYNLERDKSIQELTYIAQEAREKWEKTRVDKEAAVQEIGGLKDALLKLSDELARKKDDFEKTQKQYKDFLEETKNSYTATLETGGARLENIILKLGEDLELKYAQVEGLRKDVVAKSGLIDSLLKEKVLFEQSLIQKNNDVAEKHKEIESLRSGFAQLEQQLNILQSELSHRQEILQQVQLQRDEFRGEISTRGETIQQLKDGIQRLELERTQFQGQFDMLKAELNHRQEILQQVQLQRDEFQGEMQIQGEVIRQLEERARQLEVGRIHLLEKTNSLEQELSRRSGILNELQSQRNNLLIQVEKLNENLDQWYIKEKQQEIEASKVKLEWENEKADFGKEIEKMHSQRVELERTIEDFLRKIKSQSELFEAQKDALLREFTEKESTLLHQLAVSNETVLNHDKIITQQKADIIEKEAFVQKLFQSRTYRFLVIPFWKILNFLKWAFVIRPKGIKTVLVIKPYYVSVTQTVEAIAELRHRLGACSITLMANSFNNDAEYLQHRVPADKKIIFCPAYNKFTLLKFLRFWFWVNFSYFDQAILLIGAPVYQGYRKGKFFLFLSGAKSIWQYFTLSKIITPIHPLGFLKRSVAIFSLAWGLVSFVFVIVGFLIAVVVPLKIRNLFNK